MCAAAEPAAGLTCEQLFAAAQTAVQLRDQGHTLAQVLDALKRAQVEAKLSAVEIDTLRRAVTLAYLGNASPKEIAFECVSAQGGRRP